MTLTIHLTDILYLGYWLLLVPMIPFGLGIAVGFSLDKRQTVHNALKRKCSRCKAGMRGRDRV